jgi:hypothetical protein
MGHPGFGGEHGFHGGHGGHGYWNNGQWYGSDECPWWNGFQWVDCY